MRSILLLALVATACARPNVAPPAVELQTVTKVVEVQRPCAVTRPARPAPLDSALPTDAMRLAALLGLKLAEWSGPGGYGERADAALDRCLRD